jgi:hypothetical protein
MEGISDMLDKYTEVNNETFARLRQVKTVSQQPVNMRQ